MAQRLKHLPAMRETWVRSLGREDPLEKEMPTHSSILAWRVPWAEEPGGLQSTGSQRVGHHSDFTHFKVWFKIESTREEKKCRKNNNPTSCERYKFIEPTKLKLQAKFVGGSKFISFTRGGVIVFSALFFLSCRFYFKPYFKVSEVAVVSDSLRPRGL